jgi:hypothetical protein
LFVSGMFSLSLSWRKTNGRSATSSPRLQLNLERYAQRLRPAADERRQIVKALECKDVAEACSLLKRHIMNKNTKGALTLAPKRKDGTPLQSRTDALPDVQSDPYLLPPKGKIDKDKVIHDPKAAALEIKEWQAIINYIKSLPTKNAQGVTVLVMDERTTENRSMNTRS